MKQKYLIFSCIIAVLILSLCPVQPVSAKAKSGSRSVSAAKRKNCRLKGYLDNSETQRVPACPVEKGRTYRLKDFLKLGRDNDYKKDLRKSMEKKPKQEITLSGKEFVIKKQTFRPKKKGLYELKIETREVSYIFPLYVIDEIYKIEADEISRISITIPIIEEGDFTAVVQEPADIQQIVEKINRAEFVFDPEESKGVRSGNAGYTLGIQWKDGRVTKMGELNYGGFRIKNGFTVFGCYWSSSNSQTARECVDYIEQIFDKYVPAHKGEHSIC